MNIKVLAATVLVFSATLLGWGQDNASEAAAQLTSPDEVSAAVQKAKHGDVQSQNLLGMAYATGSGVPKDEEEAAKWFKKAASQGLAAAQFNLAGLYWEGHGVWQNAKTAVRWCGAAAAQGYAPAESALAYAYLQGHGVAQSYPEAIRWYTKAAEHGDADAQYNLALIYQDGGGETKPDCALALKWFTQAANQSQRYAQSRLGRIYAQGSSCAAQDYAEAAKWLQAAAERGDREAQSSLAWQYLAGYGVNQNDATAFYWYELAAKAGDATAQFMLGQLYRDGKGTDRDYVSAYLWFKVAVASGVTIDGTESLKSRMTPNEVAAGEVKAKVWLEARVEQPSGAGSVSASNSIDFGGGRGSGDGNASKDRQRKAHLQAAAPKIVNGPAVTVLSPTSAVITWTTDIPSDTFVFYKVDDFDYDRGVSDGGGVTIHSQTITGLWPEQTYSFGVRSRAVVGGMPGPAAFFTDRSFTLPPASTTGTFDYYFVPQGPHHVVQGYEVYTKIASTWISGVSKFKLGTYQIVIQNLPPHTAIHWPSQEYNGLGQGIRSSTYTPNDTLREWAFGATQFEIVTNAGGVTPPGSYVINITATTQLVGSAAGPAKTVPWTIAVDAPPAFPFGSPASYPAIPDLSKWETNMVTYGTGNWCHERTRTGEACAPGYEQCPWYYDGERVFYQIADYTNHPDTWNSCALNAQRVYRDQYVLAQAAPGAIPGWRVFPEGIYMNYLRTGDPASKAAVHGLAVNSAFAFLWSAGLVDAPRIREASYLVNANRLDTDLGNGRDAKAKQAVAYLLGDIEQITVSGNAESNQPFMDGLAAEALIHYYEDGHQSDVRIPTAIKTLADWMWTNAWIPGDGTNGYFYYNSYQYGIGMPSDGGSRNLNLLIAPMYAWLYKMTGNTKYQIEGDAIWSAGVEFDPAGTLGWSGKNFSQQYRWSFDFVNWREDPKTAVRKHVAPHTTYP